MNRINCVAQYVNTWNIMTLIYYIWMYKISVYNLYLQKKKMYKQAIKDNILFFECNIYTSLQISI